MKVIDQAAWDACERIYPKNVMKLTEELANLMEVKLARGSTFSSPVIFDAIDALVEKHGPVPEPTRGAIILVLTKTWVTPGRTADVWNDNVRYMKKHWKGNA